MFTVDSNEAKPGQLPAYKDMDMLLTLPLFDLSPTIVWQDNLQLSGFCEKATAELRETFETQN